MMEVDAAAETAHFFGHLLPSATQASAQERPTKVQKSSPTPAKEQGQEKGSGRKGKGRGKGGRKMEGEQDLLLQLARLSIRQEDQLNILRLDRSHVMHMRTDDKSTMLQTLHKVSTEWQKLKQEGKLTRSLRSTLFQCIALELSTRAQKVVEDPQLLESAAKFHWVTKGEDGIVRWQFIQWKDDKEQPAEDPPVPHAQILLHLEALQTAPASCLQRFHATRPLKAAMEGPSVAFLLEASHVREGERLQLALHQLHYSAVWALVGARLCPERLRRSPLAQMISDRIARPFCTESCIIPTICVTRTQVWLQ